MKCCEQCEECIAIGEGDHICMEHEVMVIEGYEPTDNYVFCQKDGEQDG